MCSQDKVIGEARAAGAIITDESSSYDDNKNGYFFSFLTSSFQSSSNEVLPRFLFKKHNLKFVPVWASWALEFMIFLDFNQDLLGLVIYLLCTKSEKILN